MCWQQSLFALLKTAWCQILLLLYSTRWLTQNFTLEITSQHCEDAFVSPLSALLSPCLLFPNTVTDAASYEINQTSSSQPEKEAQKEKLVSWAALASLHSAVEPEPSQGPLCEALYGCQLRSTNLVPSYCLQAQRRRTRFGPHSSRRWSPRSVTHIFTHFLLYTWKTNHCYYWCRYFWIIWWTRATQEWQLLQTVIEEFGKEQILLQHDRGHYSLVEAEARNLTQNANMDTPGYTKFYFQKRVVKWSHAVQRWVQLIWMAVIWKLENKGTQRQVG